MAAFEHIHIRPVDPAAFSRGTKYGPEGASETFEIGDILETESGLLVEFDGTGAITGVAARAATGVTRSEVIYWPADQDIEFYASLQDAIAEADLHSSVGLLVDGTSGKWVIDKGTSGQAIITELTGLKENPFHKPAAINDTGVVVKFKFDRSAVVGA